MKIAVDLGCPKLWLEGDSLNIINILNNKSAISWSIEATIKEIKYLIQKFEKVVISHTFREANGAADWVANYDVLTGQMMRWTNELTNQVDLKAIIHYEAIHVQVGKI